jgi:hypothetical protein
MVRKPEPRTPKLGSKTAASPACPKATPCDAGRPFERGSTCLVLDDVPGPQRDGLAQAGSAPSCLVPRVLYRLAST